MRYVLKMYRLISEDLRPRSFSNRMVYPRFSVPGLMKADSDESATIAQLSLKNLFEDLNSLWRRLPTHFIDTVVYSGLLTIPGKRRSAPWCVRLNPTASRCRSPS